MAAVMAGGLNASGMPWSCHPTWSNDPLNIQNGQSVKIIEFHELMKVTIQYNHTKKGHPVTEKKKNLPRLGNWGPWLDISRFKG